MLKQYGITSYKHDGKYYILIFGGIVRNPTRLINNSYMLSVDDDKASTTMGLAGWKEIPRRGNSVPCPRVGQSITYYSNRNSQSNDNESSINERIYVFGGYDSDDFRNDLFFWIYAVQFKLHPRRFL